MPESWTVEARRGGPEGEAKRWTAATKDEAGKMAEQLMRTNERPTGSRWSAQQDERPGPGGAGLLGSSWVDGGRGHRSPRSRGLGRSPSAKRGDYRAVSSAFAFLAMNWKPQTLMTGSERRSSSVASRTRASPSYT